MKKVVQRIIIPINPLKARISIEVDTVNEGLVWVCVDGSIEDLADALETIISKDALNGKHLLTAMELAIEKHLDK